MEPTPFDQLSDLVLLELCVWREARGESFDGKRAVAWAIKNRVDSPRWWGHDWHTVILKPWQFSSFNLGDPNHTRWPLDTDQSFIECTEACQPVYIGADTDDLTNGATHYYDTSIEWPKGWGRPEEWDNTLNIGRLKFFKMKPVAPVLGVDEATQV
jgi:hypothetical protein